MALPLAQALAEVAREDLPVGVRDMLPEVSGLFKDIKTSWEGVERSLGRPARDATGAFYASGWVKRWTVVAGGGGAFQFTDPNPNLINMLGDAVAVGAGNAATFSGTATAATGPSASEFVMPTYANPYVGLKEGRGVLAMPWQLLRASKIDNVLLDVGAENLAKAAELTALSEAVCMFSRNPAWGEVARSSIHIAAGAEGHDGIVQASFGGVANHQYLTISEWWEEDTVTRFRPGMSVDIWEVYYDSDGAAQDLKIRSMDANGFVVDQVDYVNEKVTFVTKDGAVAANDLLTGAAGDEYCYIITLKGTATLAGTAAPETGLTLNGALATTGATSKAKMDTYDAEIAAEATYVGYGMDGLVNFLKTSATASFYGVPVSRMPNLMATYVADVADYLTERYWNKVIGWHRSQQGERFMPDAIITTYGVLNGALQTAFRFEPAVPALTHPLIAQQVNRDGGKSPELGMDYGGVRLGHRGRAFKLYDDPICMKKNLFALKTRDNNISRLVPPPIPGASKQTQFQEVEFINPVVMKGIWAWARASSGRQTDYMEAPYILTANHYIKDPQGVRLRGLTEAVGLT